jgi:hypothetical protein
MVRMAKDTKANPTHRQPADAMLLWAALTAAIIIGFVVARLLWGGPIPRLF